MGAALVDPPSWAGAWGSSLPTLGFTLPAGPLLVTIPITKAPSEKHSDQQSRPRGELVSWCQQPHFIAAQTRPSQSIPKDGAAEQAGSLGLQRAGSLGCLGVGVVLGQPLWGLPFLFHQPGQLPHSSLMPSGPVAQENGNVPALLPMLCCGQGSLHGPRSHTRHFCP